MRLYRAICAWLEASAAVMSEPQEFYPEGADEARSEHAPSYTAHPELHSGYSGYSERTTDHDDGGMYRTRPVGFQRNTQAGGLNDAFQRRQRTPSLPAQSRRTQTSRPRLLLVWADHRLQPATQRRHVLGPFCGTAAEPGGADVTAAVCGSCSIVSRAGPGPRHYSVRRLYLAGMLMIWLPPSAGTTTRLPAVASSFNVSR